ncbi:MAG: TonB-dependent receptor [Parabacteroides sp.]|nr:TonB-dependent receptor [Parabacteroides sp.]
MKILFSSGKLLLKDNKYLHIFRIRRSTTFLLLIFTCFAFTENTNSQNARVNLNISNTMLKEVLDEIEQQTDYLFISNRDINLEVRVSVKAKDKPVKEVLDTLLDNSDISYAMEGLNIILSKRQSFPVITQQDKKQITGTILDERGEPIIGANVKEKGTLNGVITDLDGKFMLSVADNATLQITYIGYIAQEVQVANQTQLNIVLREDIQTLEEVVVVGFGTQKKVNLTGAVGLTTSKDLENRPVMLASQALQGLVPGLSVMQNNGSLESRANIKVRGRGTIDGDVSSNPLVLIDGIEGDINVLNPQDIESISVLKDAAASSIYGSKAPFGVILITTKKGVAGKTRVNYNNSLRWNSPLLMPETMDSHTFALYIDDALSQTPGNSIRFNTDWLGYLRDYQDGKIKDAASADYRNNTWNEGYSAYTDIPGSTNRIGGIDNRNYYKEFYRSSAFAHEHNLSLSGGSDKITFYGSFNYLDQDGLMQLNQDSYNRYSTNVKVNYKVADWLDLTYTNRFVRTEYERPSALTNDFFSNIGKQGWPTLPMYDPNGNLFMRWAVKLRDGGNDKTITDNIYQQIQLAVEPVKNWKTHIDVNYSTQNHNRHYHNLIGYIYDRDNNPQAGASNMPTTSNIFEEDLKNDLFGWNIYSEYSLTLAKNHNLKAMVGLQQQEMRQKAFNLLRQGVQFPDLPVVDLATGKDYNGNDVVPTVNGRNNNWAVFGLFSRLNYDYKGKYMAEVNMRYDESSRYRKGHRRVWSPSFSLGWNVAREEFMSSLNDYITTLKPRVSYGQLANQNTLNWYPSYSNMQLYTASGAWLQNGSRPNTAAPPGTLENRYLTWEKVNTINIGLDYGFLQNRLTGSFDYFIRTTSDMLGPAPELPAILGVNPAKVNDTELRDYGFELEIGWRDRLSNGLGYGTRFLLADYRTKVLKYPSNTTGNINTYYDNKIVGEIWGYETIGIAKTQAEMDAHLATLPNGGQNAIASTWGAGDIMYKDINGDGGIDNGSQTLGDHGDLKVIGNNTPRYQFGIDLTADWKGFDLRLFFQGVMKRDYWQGSYFFWGAQGNAYSSAGFTSHLDYFRDSQSFSVVNGFWEENLDSYYPKMNYQNNRNMQTQSRYLQDASYIRLKNLQVGYTVPTVWTSKIRIEKARIFFSGENLWTGTKMAEMFDPETIDGGWNGSVYPLSRVYAIGLNIHF